MPGRTDNENSHFKPLNLILIYHLSIRDTVRRNLMFHACRLQCAARVFLRSLLALRNLLDADELMLPEVFPIEARFTGASVCQA